MTAVVLGTLAPSALSAQGVSGRVVDAATDSAIASAEVVIRAGGVEVARILTDLDGRFETSLRGAPPFQASINALGYDTAAVVLPPMSGPGMYDLVIRVAALPLGLPGIQVTARPLTRKLVAEGFYRREARGIGLFLDREMIDSLAVTRTGDLFRRMPGIRVLQTRSGPEPISSRPTGFGGRTCYPALVLNGYEVPRRRGESLNDVILPVDIEAIEVYRGPAETPPQWNTTGCGAIVIWTR